MRKNTSGFTIVELLIAVIVIAILASITLVAYTGIQQRARTAQTITTAEQWIKGLMIYKARNGSLPSMSSCLGAGYKYDYNEQGASTVAQCKQTSSSVGVVTNPAFTAAMQPYMAGSPAPAMVTAANSTTSWYRGITYNINGTTAQIALALDRGQTCPAKISEYNRSYGAPTSGLNTNMVCIYEIGSIASYDFN
ncbi:MAG: prepilin-type N-terminal cleavage/methylation domain-containing protein [Candidatus Saccharibacteria bacterium]|nr:prepilin-type N-terminal cleavage/methylation domain-containing protein [Candidatus Saccharibacteria bacterium]